MIDQGKILERLRIALQKLIASGAFELRQQGHNATGKGINSLEVRVERVGLGDVKGQIWGFDYLLTLDTGLSPGQLPPREVHVKNLTGWAKQIGIAKAKIAAIRIDRTHRKTGIPSPGAYKWSNNGRRTDWVKFGVQVNFEKAFERFELLDLLTKEIGKAYGNQGTNI